MLTQEIVPGINLRLLEKRNASKLYDFIEKGRDGFENWIPFVSKTLTIEDTENKVDSFLESYKKGSGYYWCLWENNRVIGMIIVKNIDMYTRSAEIGCMIDKDYEGRGIVRESCRKMIEFLFDELGINKIKLCCDDNNERSIKIAKCFHFEYEGTLKQNIVINERIRNTMFWALFKTNYVK
jgi:ribosomal-protein-serine acetyltransferase